MLARIPADVDAVRAAALPCAGITVFQAVVRRLRVDAGMTVLVTAAAGGVGGFAVHLAHLAGARVLATASAVNAEHVRALGVDVVIDRRTGDVSECVRVLTDGRGVDAVVDTVSAASAKANLSLLVHGGALTAVAERPDVTALPAFTVAPSVHEITLGAVHSHGDDRAKRDLGVMLEDLLGLTASGRLNARLREIVGPEETGEALRATAGGIRWARWSSPGREDVGGAPSAIARCASAVADGRPVAVVVDH